MKIVNICPQFTDSFGYQENYLPKYQKAIGNEVTIITSDYVFGPNNEMVKCDKTNYYTEYGVKIIRLKTKHGRGYEYKFRDLVDLYKCLTLERPDVIFLHGLQFVYTKTIGKYVRNNQNVKLFVDNHADRSNSGLNWLSYNVLHKVIWKHYMKWIDPYVCKYFGVLPSRVNWLHDVYGVSMNRIQLLIMGADDELVAEAQGASRNQVFEELALSKDDFVIVTGGKIDAFKKQTLSLMRAVNEIAGNVNLIVFGSVDNELKAEFDSLLSDRIKYIGWIDSRESYKYIEAADIACFPGRHSVIWEQCVAQKKPLIVKKWEGTQHIDIGGNVLFIDDDKYETLKSVLTSVIFDNDLFVALRNAANKKESKDFLYSNIAVKSIDF